MLNVYIVADNVLSPLGSTTAENFSKLTNSVSGIRQHVNESLSFHPFYASLFENHVYLAEQDDYAPYTKFEGLLIESIKDALQNSGLNVNDEKTVLIISSTKGNISVLEKETDQSMLKNKVALHTSAKLVAGYFGFINEPLVISNACISGLLAILTGKRLIQSGLYENAVIAGADVVSKFILSGFQSFQAISPEPCRPFDAERKGINLGEGAGTVVLSSNKKYSGSVKVTGGSISNDANHISGPSRTGEELAQAIEKAINEAGLKPSDIDFISAHGTATLYNDEMEAKALTLVNMENVPVNSLKGYYGHTLGAAGLIESIISIHSFKENTVLPTAGFNEMGVTKPININKKLQYFPVKNCLKTASGFGGCNGALVFSKE